MLYIAPFSCLLMHLRVYMLKIRNTQHCLMIKANGNKQAAVTLLGESTAAYMISVHPLNVAYTKIESAHSLI